MTWLPITNNTTDTTLINTQTGIDLEARAGITDNEASKKQALQVVSRLSYEINIYLTSQQFRAWSKII